MTKAVSIKWAAVGAEHDARTRAAAYCLTRRVKNALIIIIVIIIIKKTKLQELECTISSERNHSKCVVSFGCIDRQTLL